jgi:GTP cyclohydrolase II
MESIHTQIREMLEQSREHECEGYGDDHACVKIAAMAELPSRFGDFHVVAFTNTRDGKEHAAFIHGRGWQSEDVPVRLHSECVTGDAIGSLRCDCRDQLETALKMIGKMDKGILLYLRQEGRGIGFVNKIRAYELQDAGLDTVEANLALGFRDDERDYSIAAHMLDSLQVKSIRLITNNPRKINALKALGINVMGRIPIVIPPNEYNRFYLETKARKSGHLIDFRGKVRLMEQADRPIVEGMNADEVDDLSEEEHVVREPSRHYHRSNR